MKVLRRVRRRWCLSLLPMAWLAPLAIPFSETLVAFVGYQPHHSALACSCGLLIGAMLASLAVTISVVPLMQMSASVRMLLLMVYFNLTVAVLIALPWTNEISEKYLPELMLVIFGALIGRLFADSIHQDTGTSHSLTGSTSRETGVHHWLPEVQCWLFAGMLLLMLGITIHQDDPREIQVASMVAVVSFLLGFASAWSLLADFGEFGRTLRVWARGAAAIVASVGVYLLSLSWDQEINASVTGTRMAISVSALVSFLLTQQAMLRFLRWSKWHWKHTRQIVIARGDGQLNVTATDRLRNLIQQRALPSIAGVLMFTVGFLLMMCLGNEIMSEMELLIWVDELSPDLIEGTFVCVSVGFMLASMTVLGIIADHHCRTLFMQTILLASCYVFVLLSIEITVDSVMEIDFEVLLTASAFALPAALATRMILALVNRVTSFRIGVMPQPRRQLKIRSIMGLTLLVGIQIVMLQGVFADLVAAEVFAIVTGFIVAVWFHAITLIWLRLYLGRKSLLHWFWLVTLILVPSIAAGFSIIQFTTIEWAGALVAFSGVLTTYFGSLGLLTSWLRFHGWRKQPTSDVMPATPHS